MFSKSFRIHVVLKREPCFSAPLLPRGGTSLWRHPKGLWWFITYNECDFTLKVENHLDGWGEESQ